MNPLGILIDDFYKGKAIIGLMLLFLGMVFLFYKEKILDGWKEKVYKIPADSTQYRTHIILIGIISSAIGLAFVII